jgi:hypothetical protein
MFIVCYVFVIVTVVFSQPMDAAAALSENQHLKAESAALRANVQALSFQLAQLKRLIFGARSEQLQSLDAHSGLLFEVAAPPAPQPATVSIRRPTPTA